VQPEPTAGVVPIHHQIANDIRAKIISGELQPGDAVPSVRELAGKWKCAPLSARNALAVLAGEGRLSGGRGKRATVRMPLPRIRLTMAMAQEQKDLVLAPRRARAARGTIEMTADRPIESTVSTHHYEIVGASLELANEFDVKPGTELQRRQYEMTDRETGLRLTWSTSYIPLSLIAGNPDLLDERLEPWPGGHQHQLYTVGIEIDRMVRSVTAVAPSPGDRQRWGMDQGVPLLAVRTRSIDTVGRIVELSDAVYPADRTELVFSEQLQRWPDDHPAYDKKADVGSDLESSLAEKE
jgi:GntR family transcriptional regulator